VVLQVASAGGQRAGQDTAEQVERPVGRPRQNVLPRCPAASLQPGSCCYLVTVRGVVLVASERGVSGSSSTASPIE